MPDNTWFTPYKLPLSKCLSLSPSQGIVYELNKRVVVKLPFQYPVGNGSTIDAKKDHLYLSLRSFALLKRERQFYDLLTRKPHPNIAQKFPSDYVYGIFLEHLNPIEEVWASSTKDMRMRWTQQLLSALAWIEKLGYTHGDIAIRNLGVDRNGQLKLFDFGSITHKNDEDFDEQVLDDHFSLASCIHFLASGIDPLAKAESAADFQRIRSDLERGTAFVEEAARDLQQVIQAGWMRIPRSSSSFSRLQETVADIIGASVVNGSSPPYSDPSDFELSCPDLLLTQAERDLRWMDQEDYRTAWKEKGYDMSAYI
jgi:serine/threonine protein kinase